MYFEPDWNFDITRCSWRTVATSPTWATLTEHFLFYLFLEFKMPFTTKHLNQFKRAWIYTHSLNLSSYKKLPSNVLLLSMQCFVQFVEDISNTFDKNGYRGGWLRVDYFVIDRSFLATFNWKDGVYGRIQVLIVVILLKLIF